MGGDVGLAPEARSADTPSVAGRYAQIKELFLAALDVPVEERNELLVARAGGDEAMLEEVRSLLAHEGGAPVLREPLRGERDPLGAVGAMIDGRYRIEAFVDEGGFSYVYRAVQLVWARPVAVKFFKEHRAARLEAIRQAFIKEGALLAELSRRTSSIVQSYDAGTWTRGDETRLYTVLEWLDGETLAARLARERKAGAGGWPLADVVPLLGPIADALAIAFDLGVAHRDLKPGNIFLADLGGRVVPKLLDFGSAKVATTGRGFHVPSSVAGVFTVAYAAPEQLVPSLGSTGPWTDVYALALLCAELLLGRAPFVKGDNAMLVRRMQGGALTPADLGLELPAAADAVLATALMTQPAARFPDVRTFWDALRAAAKG